MGTTNRVVRKSKNGTTEGKTTKQGTKNKQLLRSHKDQKERKKSKRNNIMIHNTNINKEAKSTSSPTSSIQTNFSSCHLVLKDQTEGFSTPTQLSNSVKLPQKPNQKKSSQNPVFLVTNPTMQKSNLLAIHKEYQDLVSKCKQKDALIEKLMNEQKQHAVLPKSKRSRESKKITTYLDYICNKVLKDKIFRLVKFISDDRQLENFDKPGSIGYQFLQELKKEDQVEENGLVIEEHEKDIWSNAKALISDAFSQKRNARQTQIKKAWKGK